MEPAPLPPEMSSAARALAGRLGAICLGLAALIAHAFLRNPARVAIIVPLWTRLRRTAGRFDRLLARIAHGKDQPHAPRARASDPAAPARQKIAFPAPHGWLLKDLRHEGALYTQRLASLLSEPETAALIAHSPRMLRLLRPLCHMLGVRHAAVPPSLRRRKRPAPVPAAARHLKPGLIENARSSRPLLPASDRALPPRDANDRCPHFLRWPWVPLNAASAV